MYQYYPFVYEMGSSSQYEEEYFQPMMPTQPMYPQQPYPMQPSQPMYPQQPYPMQPSQPSQPMIPTPVSPETGVDVPGQLPVEQSYIENILRLNLGKIATIYMTFENNNQWNAKIFKGKLEAAGRDHIIISDPATGMRYLLLMVNLDYITFDEELEYVPPMIPGR